MDLDIKKIQKRVMRNSPIRWKQVGFVHLPHLLLFDATLPRPALMIYWVLMVHQFRGKKSCAPSLSLIAQESRYSKPTVIRAINALEAAGWLDVERRHRAVSEYWVKAVAEKKRA